MADLKDNAAADAIEEAVRRKTVAIVYGTGRSKWREVGSGTLALWAGKRVVLTAAHVGGSSTPPADLRFFLPFRRPPGSGAGRTPAVARSS